MSFLVVLGAETRRTVRLVRSYWIEYAADFLLYAVGFLLLIAIFRAGSDSYGPQGYLSTLIGYVTWKIGASVLIDIAKIASEEARTGTLEQMFLTGQGLGRAFIGRSVGILLNYGVRGILLGAGLAAILGIFQPVPPLAVVVFLVTILGACGLGFALAGLVLVYKRLDGFLHLLWQMLVFFTGALAPITHSVLGAVARLLPLTWGIEALREIVLEGADMSSLLENGTMIGLVGNTIIYVVLGVALFAWGQRQARTLGVLAHY